jgi:hypothetical protein
MWRIVTDTPTTRRSAPCCALLRTTHPGDTHRRAAAEQRGGRPVLWQMFDMLAGTHVGTESTLITFADRACAHGTLPDPQPDAVEALDYEGACV